MKTSNYPIQIITNYRAGKISRQQFTKQFSDWQKSRGINYDCKGTADERGVHVEYRGTTATIRDGKLSFIVSRTAQHIFYGMKQILFLNSAARLIFPSMR